MNKNSTKAIKDQVKHIKTLSNCRFDNVFDTYMEEPPFIADWAKLARTPNVVVVPFFIADGLHSYQDIPVMLGFEKEEGLAASQKEIFRRNPYHLQNKTLYYSAAIGTEPMMADVILDQISTFDANNVAH
ncbi:MAG: CbiX/SirB N-terminal domain-containing protein [Verrucomicrobiales bacterium]